MAASSYDAHYYCTSCGPRPYTRNDEWLWFFGAIADEIVRSLRPKRVFDAGCAMGMLVESLWDRGVEAWGADISEYAIGSVRRDMRPYCRVGSIVESAGGKFDLVVCIEVLEHMPEEEARRAVGQFAEAADTVLFSSNPNDFTEPTHINVHPIIYWLKLFQEHGYQPELTYDAGFVSPHAILFRKSEQRADEDVLMLMARELRFKTALVEREQRIGRLNEEAAKSEAELRDAKARLAELAAERVAGEQDRTELEAVRKRALEAADRVAALEGEAVSLRERAAEFAVASAESQNQLRSIEESPGGKLIVRYRNWLRAARMHHPFIERYWEPAAARLLRTLGRGSAAGGSALTPVAAPGNVAYKAVSYDDWVRLTEPSEELLVIQRVISRELAYRPKISIVLPVYKVQEAVLSDTLASVRNQTYDNWELCIVHADPEADGNRALMKKLADTDARIRVEFLDSNLGISGNSNRALAMSTGEFIALLDHDDTLAPFALFEVAQRLNEDAKLDFIYSDKDQLSEDGRTRVEPLFKPNWSPDLLWSANYLTHLCVLRTSLVREIDGWRSETDGAQDWDLFLRAIEKSNRIAHIPKVLYHWRRVATSVAARGNDAKPYVAEAQLRTLRFHLERQGWQAEPTFTPAGLTQLQWKNADAGRISVIVPSDDQADVEKFRERIPEPLRPRVELLVASPTVARLNKAVRGSSGEIVVFLDRAVGVGVDTWLEELAGIVSQPGIGIAGCKLFSIATHQIRHAGICFNADGEIEYPFANETDYVYNSFGGANWYRDWLAVSGACFAIRREVFDRVGGFSETPAFPRLDVDLCLRVVLDAGLRVVYNPFARMWQDEEALLERSLPGDGAAYIRSTFPEGDPLFNPNLDCSEGRVDLRLRGDSARRDHNYAEEARLLVQTFDSVPEEIEESITSCSRAKDGDGHFVWFIPDFQNGFYGGIHTILRFADYFRRAHRVRSTFAVLGRAHPASILRRIARVSPELAASSTVQSIDSYAGLAKLEPAEAAIATLWTTAYFALRFNKARDKFYFLQDQESLFYPAGSTSALADATWGFGFKGICNTVTLRDLYVERGGRGEFFSPCVDADVFYPASVREWREPYTLFCYARPHHARNCFELICEAIRILKRRMGDRISIVTAGDEWDPARFGLGGLVQNLGLLNYRATGALYRSCDAGLVTMATAHPSYLPLELMACGSLVITNENPKTAWLLRDRVNCLLAGTTPGALAEAVEEGLRNHELRRRITENAGRMVREEYLDWDGAAEKVFAYMRSSEPVGLARGHRG